MTRRFQSSKGKGLPAMMSSFYRSLILISLLCTLSHADEPAQVTGFAVNGSTGYDGHTTSVGNVVIFECNTTGDPSPGWSIWRYRPFDDTYLLQVGETHDGSQITKTASCTDNGWYRCRAENTYQGHPYIAFGGRTRLLVECPLSSCSGTDDPQICVAIPGQDASCRLCVVVHPYHWDNLYVEKETQNGWEIRRNVKLDIFPYPPLLDVDVQFNPMNFGDLGNLRLVHRADEGYNNTLSYVYFQMIEVVATESTTSSSSQTTDSDPNSGIQRDTDSNSDQDSNSDEDSNSDSYISLSTAAIVDVVLAGLLILTIFTIVCVYLCGRKSQMAKVGQQPA